MARRRGMPAAKMNSYLPRSRFGERGLFVFNRGPVAQLGARFHGMEEVVGSIPTAPTKSLQIVGFFTLLVLKMMRCPQLGDKRMVRDVGKSCVHAVDDTTIRSPRSLFLSGLNYG